MLKINVTACIFRLTKIQYVVGFQTMEPYLGGGTVGSLSSMVLGKVMQKVIIP
jgi:hypothetical protein